MIREHKAIKCVEFSNFHDLIMDPNEWYTKYTETKHNKEPKAEYRDFLENNKKYFNPSQHNALKYTANMGKSGLSLIQGPPGTGKTHTILGLISMAVT